MENQLKFHETLSLEGFKQNVGGDTQLDVIENPATKKVFFSCGKVTGAISESIDYAKDIAVSRVTGNDDVSFWLLHNKKTDNLKRTL